MSGFSDEVLRRENVRAGNLNRETYVALKKMPKKEVRLLQNVYIENLQDAKGNFLMYVRDFIRQIEDEGENRNIFYNPCVAKASIVGVLVVIIVVVAIAIRFS